MVATSGTFVAFTNANLVLDFGSIDAGTSHKRVVQLWNQGKASIVVERSTELSAPFSIAEQGAVELAAGAKAVFTIGFETLDAGQYLQALSLKAADATALISIRATASIPVAPEKNCNFVITPKALDFGLSDVGVAKMLEFTVDNLGDDGCPFEFPAKVGPFSVVDLDPISVFDRFEKKKTRVEFKPDAYSTTYSEQLPFTTVASVSIAALKLTGRSALRCPVFPNDGTCPKAEPGIYANTHDALWKITPGASAVRIAPFLVVEQPPTMMTDVAISPAGDLFGLAGPIYAIDPVTGACRVAAAVPETVVGLTFLPDGRVVAAGAGLFIMDLKVDPPTVELVKGTNTLITSGDVVALSNDHLLWTVAGGDTLVDVRLDAGTVTVVGSLNADTVYGLAFENSTVYGYTLGGQELIIDPATASVTSSRSLPSAWYGAASKPP